MWIKGVRTWVTHAKKKKKFCYRDIHSRRGRMEPWHSPQFWPESGFQPFAVFCMIVTPRYVVLEFVFFSFPIFFSLLMTRDDFLSKFETRQVAVNQKARTKRTLTRLSRYFVTFIDPILEICTQLWINLFSATVLVGKFDCFMELLTKSVDIWYRFESLHICETF